MRKVAAAVFVFTVMMFGLIVTAKAQGTETYDVVTYKLPAGWQKQPSDRGLQLSRVNTSTNEFAMAIVIKSLPSDASAADNFTHYWNTVVKATVKVGSAPMMEAPMVENGWDVVSGSANFTDGGVNGVVTQLIATGGGKVTGVIIMTNTSSFQSDLLSFLSSIKLPKAAASQTRNAAPVSTSGNSSLVGLWVNYNTETSGYMNGMPMLSGGYFRREYLFKPDGTYVFRAKDWSTIVKDILYVKETGTYSVNGNQITIKPTQTSGGWWAKAASGRTVGWGKKVRGSTHKSEPVTYTFEIKYLSGMGENYLILRSRYATERDGRQNSGGSGTHEYNYSHRATGESLIDDPQ